MNQSKMGRPTIDLKERAKGLEEEFYTPEELAKELKVHYKTILNQIKKGTIKAYKIGNQYRIKKKDIQWWIIMK